MSPQQNEISRIIARFSPKERQLFARMGGELPAVSPLVEIAWRRPGDAIAGFCRQSHRPTVLLRVDGKGSYSIREVAELLNVQEGTIRNKMRGGSCVVRGSVVERINRTKQQEAA